MLKHAVFVALFIVSVGLVGAQNINTPENFPDPTFRLDVERFLQVGSGDPFTAEEAASATGVLTLIRNAEDATGIEWLTGMTGLHCSRSNLTALDISQNVNLELLLCEGQSLTHLDLSENHALTQIDCSNNQLQSLILPENSNLFKFRCQNNHLNELRIHNAEQLEILDCSHNEIERVALVNTPSLFYHNASGNNLQDVSPFVPLESLTSLDLTRNLLGCDQIEHVRELVDRLGPAKSVQLNQSLTTVLGFNVFEQTIEHACFQFAPDVFPEIKTESGQEEYYLLDDNGESIMQGLLYFPPNYSENGEPMPLLVFHQGSGEIGPNLFNLDNNGIPQMLSQGDQLPFVVLSPQFQGTNDFMSFYRLYDAVLDDVTARFHIDTRRIYVTGLSLGGTLTYLFPLWSDYEAAALLPIAEGIFFFGQSSFDISLLTEMPIWGFHGTNDQAVSVEEHLFIVDIIRSLGGDIRFTLVQGADHEQSWKRTYNDPVVYSWLLNHQREQLVDSSIFDWATYK